MGKTMPTLPQRPQNPKRFMYPNSERYYKSFNVFMTCMLALFILSLVTMCIMFG